MIADRSTKKVNALTFMKIDFLEKQPHGRTRNVKSESFQERIRDFTFYKKKILT